MKPKINKLKVRPKVGIIIDNTIRIPDFIPAFRHLKKQIIDGSDPDYEDKKILDTEEFEKFKVNYFSNVFKLDRKAYNFYEKVSVPKKEEIGVSYDKYFYRKEDLEKFLHDYGFNLYANTEGIIKEHVEYLNIAQKEVADIILLDKITNFRKTLHTYAFLSRSRIFVKEVRFYSTEVELVQLKKELYETYDPKDVFNDNPVYYNSGEENQFLKWLMNLENKSKKFRNEK